MKTTIELKEIVNDFISSGYDFCYRMLSRMKQDCKYYINYSIENEMTYTLWAKNTYDQIELMKMIYEILPEKPEWISMEKIEEYAEKMLPNNWCNNFSAFEWEEDGFVCKAPAEFECEEQSNLAISLIWEKNLNFELAGEDGCISNYDMYTPLYNWAQDKLFLIPYSEAEKWKRGEIVRIYGRKITDEERKEIMEYLNR